MRIVDHTIYNKTELENRQAEVATRMEETVALMNQLISENATAAHDPDEYDRRYQQLEQRYQQQEKEHQKIGDRINDLTIRRTQAAAIHDYLVTRPPLEFSDEAWNTLIKQAIVEADGSIKITFKDQANPHIEPLACT